MEPWSLFCFLSTHKGFIFLRTELGGEEAGKDRVKHLIRVSLGAAASQMLFFTMM